MVIVSLDKCLISHKLFKSLVTSFRMLNDVLAQTLSLRNITYHPVCIAFFIN